MDKAKAELLDIGVGEQRIAPGDHLCVVYSNSSERDALVGPYLRSALRSGDKCVCILDTAKRDDVLASIGDQEIDIASCTQSGQLELLRSADTFLRSGRFSATDSIGFWKAAIAGAMNSGRYPHVRAIGDWSVTLREAPGGRELAQFELQLNRLLALYPQVMMCMYDMDCFDGSFLVDVVSTHPKVLVNGAVIENAYFMQPEDWLNLTGG
jgi:hypothetical protein